MTIAALGHVTRDVVAGSAPRPGGGVFWSTRALAHLGVHAVVSAACSADDRASLLPPLEAFGLPVTWIESSATTAYSFHYEGDRRIMWQDAVGDPWSPEQAVAAVGEATWINVCALTRTDFPPETLAALARGRRVLLDGQGLVRARETGPLQLDADFDPALLEHVAILKLAEEEAEVILGRVDASTVATLGVPEVVVTYGARGSVVFADGRADEVAAWPVVRDPTGAGDGFAAAYLAARAGGHAPAAAARRATALVGALLMGRAA